MIRALVLAGVLAASPALAAPCSTVVSTYEAGRAQADGLLPDIFAGWDTSKPLDFVAANGLASAQASCAGGDLVHLMVLVGYDAGGGAKALIAFTTMAELLGVAVDPKASLSKLIPKAAASGSAESTLAGGYAAAITVQKDADNGGIFTVSIDAK